VAAWSQAWVCSRSLAGVVGSNPAGGHGCLSPVSVVCCQVEVSASGCSLVQGSPTECGVFECDREASVVNIFSAPVRSLVLRSPAECVCVCH
jgi:hypothetical protein